MRKFKTNIELKKFESGSIYKSAKLSLFTITIKGLDIETVNLYKVFKMCMLIKQLPCTAAGK